VHRKGTIKWLYGTWQPLLNAKGNPKTEPEDTILHPTAYQGNIPCKCYKAYTESRGFCAYNRTRKAFDLREWDP
jgi:hypothetical protein